MIKFDDLDNTDDIINKILNDLKKEGVNLNQDILEFALNSRKNTILKGMRKGIPINLKHLGVIQVTNRRKEFFDICNKLRKEKPNSRNIDIYEEAHELYLKLPKKRQKDFQNGGRKGYVNFND